MRSVSTWKVLAVAGALVAAAPLVLLAADRETVTPQFAKPMPNVPGKTLTVVRVDYAPGAKSCPHRHAASGFIYAYVLSGAVRSQVDDEAVKVYRASEAWSENPGARHRVSENASDTEPASLLAMIVADTGDRLTTFDCP